MGGQRVSINFSPFEEVARLLYESAFIAERYSGIRTFLEEPHVRLPLIAYNSCVSCVFLTRKAVCKHDFALSTLSVFRCSSTYNLLCSASLWGVEFFTLVMVKWLL